MQINNEVFDGVVIGGGIGALTFLYELSIGQSFHKEKKWAIIFDHDLAKPCSENTTATVSLSRIEEGVSPLGDLLFKSFYHFRDFVYPSLCSTNSKITGECIEKVSKKMLFFSDTEKEKARIRYSDFSQNNFSFIDQKFSVDALFRIDNDSYLIEPHNFQKFLLDTIREKLNLTIFKDFIKSIGPISSTQQFDLFGFARNYKANFIFDARGAYQKEMAHFFDTTFNQKEVHSRSLKTVAGSFLQHKLKSSICDNSIYLVVDDINFIFRKKSLELIIGSTSVEGAKMAPALDELKLKYDFILSILDPHVREKIPAFKDFHIHTGLRSKAKKRTPIIKSVGDYPNYWALSGLYKNGYTTGFFLAKNFIANELT